MSRYHKTDEEKRGYDSYNRPGHSRYDGDHEYAQGWDSHEREDRRHREEKEEERQREELEERRSAERALRAARCSPYCENTTRLAIEIDGATNLPELLASLDFMCNECHICGGQGFMTRSPWVSVGPLQIDCPHCGSARAALKLAKEGKP